MRRNQITGLALAGLLLPSLLGLAQIDSSPAAAAPRGAASTTKTQGISVPDSQAGARVPFLEYEAETATTNGAVLGPDRAYGTLAAEAVGRQAVQLKGEGNYVEFTLKEPANAVNVRLSIPDSVDGAGLDATLGVYVDGQRLQSLNVTSRYSWYYGLFPWTNSPADGGQRQLYDDSRVLLGKTLPAGTKVRLQVGAADTAPWYAIDVADFEKVDAPTTAPRESLSVLDYGADRTGMRDASDAIQATLDAASGTGRTVWIPEGTYKVTRHLIVDKVTMRGAGTWHSVLTGAGVGVYGNYNPTPSSDVHLSDFAVFGEVRERVDNDQINAIGGAMANSAIDNVWLQHTKVGMWFDGPFDNLQITRARILDQTGDGLNFHNGITNSSVSDSYIRNTGDDGLAMWSDINPNVGNTFTRNTVKVPVLANNIAIYGGSDTEVSRNWVTDTVTQGGGIQIANRFGSVPLSGTTTVERNELDRTGTLDLFTRIGNGALLFWAGDAPMNGLINVERNLITDSSYSAVQFLGKPISNVNVNRNTIDGAGTFAVQLNAAGSATFNRNTARNLGNAAIYDCDSGFTVTSTRNEGFDDATCGYPTPGPLEVTDLGADLMFTTGSINSSSEPKTITITNPTNQTVHIASVTATGTYTLTHDCGTELAPGASCAATVTFDARLTGDRNGALTISDGTPSGRYQVYLRGDVFPTTGNLAATRPAIASGEVPGCCIGANATDSNTDTYWESTNNAFPQTLTVDFGRTISTDQVAFKTNPLWGSRVQTLEVLASDDNQNFETIVPAADYTFDPTTNANTITINYPTLEHRYLQVKVTGNTGWPAAQIAEFEAYNTLQE